LKIVVDAMGGDHAPFAVVAGSVEAVNELDIPIALVGQEEKIEKELKKFDYPKNLLEIIPAPEVVEMHEPAIVTIRKKKKSSITVGINSIKGADSHAFISAGNTGAVVAAATINLGMLNGVERPAIGLVIPTLKKFSFLIDVGANTAAKSQHYAYY